MSCTGLNRQFVLVSRYDFSFNKHWVDDCQLGRLLECIERTVAYLTRDSESCHATGLVDHKVVKVVRTKSLVINL